MFALLTFGHSIFGIVAITKQRSKLLSTYSYTLLITFTIKLLFIIASLAMYTGEKERNLLSLVATLIIVTSIIEIILVMIVCQFSRLVKRGDAARQEIQSIHSYHKRDRSQSQIRSIHGNDFNIELSDCNNQTQTRTPTPLPLLTNSRNVSIEPSSIITYIMANNDDESSNNYLPPPPPPTIYLKLDK
ncbi:hypothetical protein BLA29_004715 [Euroglyphus maynei]|uniref:Uncharacterized protein n=1 Tax=Euroglyphus maynei TaxID=6958 RepID=A0A1Y3B8J8_EURMA|nr:hypothetical protein BLA29_004715 [Euroglyphus maynei]